MGRVANFFGVITVVVVVSSAQVIGAAEELPLNPAVTPQTTAETICVPGWTKTIRPPVSYTAPIKRRLFDEYGLPPELMGDFQLDHVIPLALGGAPSDPRNFQLMDQDEAERKDDAERCLARAVCAGRVGLNEAREAIWLDWKAAAKRLCVAKIF
jgi:hypothetical protein